MTNTPARTLSKSSGKRSLSSSGNSAPGSPTNEAAAFPPTFYPSDSSSQRHPHPNHSPPSSYDHRPPVDNANQDGPSSSSSNSADSPFMHHAQMPNTSSSNDTTNSNPSNGSNIFNSTNNATQSAEPASSTANTPNTSLQQSSTTSTTRPQPPHAPSRHASFGLNFLSTISNTIRGSSNPNSSSAPNNNSATNGTASTANEGLGSHPEIFMSNSPTMNNLNSITGTFELPAVSSGPTNLSAASEQSHLSHFLPPPPLLASEPTAVRLSPAIPEATSEQPQSESISEEDRSGKDKDGFFSVRLTPIIDHLSSNTGLYFSPMIRRVGPKQSIFVGRYTEKNKSAAHAPQGSSAPIVFKSKVVSRTHAMFECNEEGLWFLKDCKSSSGTFLNNIRLSQASQELTLWPLMDGDVVQLGLDYRGGTEEVYRCVKMRCEFNRSWQRKVNQFNLDIHKKMKNLGIDTKKKENDAEFPECAICLLKLEPCQAVFISPCSHSWHYKCIRPIIIKSYPQFYCPNCRSMCDLETDIEDE